MSSSAHRPETIALPLKTSSSGSDAAEEAAAACLKGRTLADEIAALAELTVEDANALMQTALREENRAYVQIDPAEK